MINIDPNRSAAASRLLYTITLLFGVVTLFAAVAESAPPPARKIGLLLVNHGSRSETWRKSLLSLEDRVRPALMTNQTIRGIKTAFMEYTEPSIATRLKEFDAEGYTDVVIVPVFLTVSPHTFDDIPTIIGMKVDPQSLEMLKIENIERYTPKAKVALAPNLDFPGVLKENILRRAKRLSTDPANEGLVLIAYGDETYEKEWAALLAGVGDYVKTNTGIAAYSHGWCGHVAHYDPKKTTSAIEEVLKTKQKAVVIPVLVAHDENFQIKIIGGGIAKVADSQSRVVYRPDSILPDPNIEQWVIRIAGQYAGEIAEGRRLASTQRP
ncbi:MAG: CbiX/SirB N-terminal domain-containing protein [Verrucomicrobiota bacterium]